MDIAGKKIVVMGLGLHGGGLPVAKWFFAHGAEVIVTDLKNREGLLPTLEKLDAFCRAYRLKHSDKRFISVEYILGRHRESDFCSADIVVQNPAVPRSSPYLDIARSANVPIENETSLFFLLTPPIPKIGVTGTRGKSTTTSLLFEMVRRNIPKAQVTSVALPSGSQGGFEVIDALLDSASQSSERPMAVMELSSWQLEGLAEHELSPHIAVMTNIFPDHLNRYRDMDEYIDAKKTIYRFQKSSDSAIFNFDNSQTRQCGGEQHEGTRYWFSRKNQNIERGTYCSPSVRKPSEDAIWMRDADGEHELFFISDIIPIGEHMIENVLAASCAAWVAGVRADAIRDAVQNFKGIPSRLEYIGDVGGRHFYNDTAATSPEGTIVALQTLATMPHNALILIAGGSDKGLDFSSLAPVISESVSHAVLFTGTATPRLVEALVLAHAPCSIEYAASMKEAVGKAWQRSREGDILLLSPASASFGLFINEFDRGGQFEECVTILKNEHA
ncbi:MAG: UDP-N-acetylmuramoyl-L-alanine--D-glutamate ligase [Patescibacteria group bacterium]